MVLAGKVHAWYERDLAEQAAWAAPGVTAVVDHILIEFSPADRLIPGTSLQFLKERK